MLNLKGYCSYCYCADYVCFVKKTHDPYFQISMNETQYIRKFFILSSCLPNNTTF